MTVVVITPSLEHDWIRPLSALRTRNVSVLVCLVDSLAHDLVSRGTTMPPIADEYRQERARALRAVRHELEEEELRTYVLAPGVPLGDQMVSGSGRVAAVAR
jgi:hypothetical protein